jgi:hypothetical protein
MVSYVYDGVRIEWSGHAIKRLQERFEYDCKIPNERIVQAFRKAKVGRFTVVGKWAVFGCKIISYKSLVVLTVYKNPDQTKKRTDNRRLDTLADSD